MKKKICLLLIPLILLSGCTNKIDEMKSAWKKEFSSELEYTELLGEFNEKEVFIIVEKEGSLTKKNVADFSFEYIRPFEIWCWNMEFFKTLENAYTSQWFSINDIKNINNSYTEFVQNSFKL